MVNMVFGTRLAALVSRDFHHITTIFRRTVPMRQTLQCAAVTWIRTPG